MHGNERQREEVVDERGDEDDQLRNSREWDRLHPPLLEMILQRLPIPDYFRCPAVCHPWLKVHRDIRSTSYLGSKVPWLMLLEASNYRYMYLFYSISEKRVYRIPRLDPVLLRSHRIMTSSFGWLLLNKTFCRMDMIHECFFLHPISGEKIHLPVYEGAEWIRDVVALSSPPSDPNCVIVVPSLDGFAVCRIGDQTPQWRACKSPPGCYHRDDGHICDVAFCNGRFYGLTHGLKIVTLDFDTADTTVIRMLNMDCRQLPKWPISSHMSILVSGGELLLFRACDLNLERKEDCPPDVIIQAYKANFKSMTWVRVWSLGEHQVFLSARGSISLDSSSSCLGGGRRDLVYLSYPRRWCMGWSPLSQLCLLGRIRSPPNQWCLLEHDLKNGTTRYLQHPVRTKSMIFLDFTWVSPSLV